MLLSGFKASTVEPDKGGKALFVRGVVDVEFATFQFVTIRLARMKIGYLFLRTVALGGTPILTVT